MPDSPSFTAANTPFVTPDTTPDKLTTRPLTDHTDDLFKVRSTHAKRRITYAADTDETECDTDIDMTVLTSARQLWMDEQPLSDSTKDEDETHKNVLDLSLQTVETAETADTQETLNTLNTNDPIDTVPNETTATPLTERTNNLFTRRRTVKFADDCDDAGQHDSPVRHCANSWWEIDEEGTLGDDEASDDEPRAKRIKANHFVTCRSCNVTYDGFAQCCVEMDHIHHSDDEDEDEVEVEVENKSEIPGQSYVLDLTNE